LGEAARACRRRKAGDQAIVGVISTSQD
jgi:hypothetical protein